MKNSLEERDLSLALYEIYGGLLTASQQGIFEDYYKYDLSLSEIASNHKISRSAVEDSLSKSLHKLKGYEAKIAYVKKKEKLQSLLKEGKQSELEEYINHGL